MSDGRATLLLARHGETSWNALGMLQGHTDIPLNQAGRDQARVLAEALAGHALGAVWTSDLARARETGQIVAQHLGLGELQQDVELRERAFGVFEGLTRAQCSERHPEAWAAWQAHNQAPPGGEPSARAVIRLGQALERIAEAATATTLVVSHGGVMRLWLSSVLGSALPLIGNGETWRIEFAPAGARVTRLAAQW